MSQFNNIQEAQACIDRINSYDTTSKAEMQLLESAQAYILENTQKPEKQEQKTEGGLHLDDIETLSSVGLKKKSQIEINKLQLRSVLSAYKRTRDTAIQLESAAEHGNKELFEFMAKSMRTQQENALKILGTYAGTTFIGRWMQSIHGVGPVISAIITAEIDPEKQRGKSCSHLISFAGYNPKMVWNKGEKRPYNAELKLALYYFAAGQLKMSGNPNNYYGAKVLRPHMEDSWRRNLRGGYADTAYAEKDKCNKNTLAWAFYNGCFKPKDVAYIRDLSEKSINEDGVILDKKKLPAYINSLYMKYMGKPNTGTPMLPPAHMLQRSMRFVSVVFLNHLYEIMVRFELDEKDYKHTPYILTTMGGHDPLSFIPAPNDCEEYVKRNPNAKLDMSKLSPQNLRAWLYGEQSVFAEPLNFITDKEVDTLGIAELQDLQNQADQRVNDSIERALYKEGE